MSRVPRGVRCYRPGSRRQFPDLGPNPGCARVEPPRAAGHVPRRPVAVGHPVPRLVAAPELRGVPSMRAATSAGSITGSAGFSAVASSGAIDGMSENSSAASRRCRRAARPRRRGGVGSGQFSVLGSGGSSRSARLSGRSSSCVAAVGLAVSAVGPSSVVPPAPGSPSRRPRRPARPRGAASGGAPGAAVGAPGSRSGARGPARHGSPSGASAAGTWAQARPSQLRGSVPGSPRRARPARLPGGPAPPAGLGPAPPSVALGGRLGPAASAVLTPAGGGSLPPVDLSASGVSRPSSTWRARSAVAANLRTLGRGHARDPGTRLARRVGGLVRSWDSISSAVARAGSPSPPVRRPPGRLPARSAQLERARPRRPRRAVAG